jgi:antitoxin HicB
MIFAYSVRLIPEEEGGYRVNFRDVPEALTQGETLDEALDEAADCLAVALSGYMQARLPLLRPSPSQPGERLILLPPLVTAKLALYEAMREEKVSQSTLALRLGLSETAVRRLLALAHRSHIGQVERALAALGRRLVVVVEDAA